MRNRLRSYIDFHRLNPRIQKMVASAQTVRMQVLTSELEALLVEAELIHTHQPPYNILLKDDKSAIYLHITNEQFPRVLTTRKREVVKNQPNGKILGPFSSTYKLNEVLKLVRPIFRWCNQRGNNPPATRPCFYVHLEQCSGACINQQDATTYQATIKQLELFLRGKTKEVVNNITQKMQDAAAENKFEKAARYRDMLQLINDVTNPKLILKPELTMPRLNDSLEKEGITYIQSWLANYLHLPKQLPLHRIECYDVSNTSGKQPTVAMVVAENGRPNPAAYRLFNIRSLDTPNDFAMLKEAVTRRQNHPEWGWPDLMVMDGGKGQLRAVWQVWDKSAPLISIAKDPDRIILPISNDKQKIIGYHELKLADNNPGLQLIQRLRDEAHRFSQLQHKRMRLKNMLNLLPNSF